MTDSEKVTTWTAQEVVSALRVLAQEKDLPSHLIEAEITDVDTMESLGIDSLGQVYVVERLEQMTGLLMPDEFLGVHDSIAVIAASLNILVRSER